MARIQVLELPAQVVGDFVKTPFVLVIDQVSEDSPLHTWPEGAGNLLREQIAAQAVLIVSDTLDLVRD
jgi:hypothetical protein